MINTDNLFVTRFNNKTFNESVHFNKNINKTTDEIKNDEIIQKWIKFDIPNMENRVKKLRKMMYKAKDESEKKETKKKKVKIQKDIEYLKHRIKEHYSQNTVRITCDTIAESKDLTEEWIYNTPTKIHDSINVGEEIYIFEMNNDMNKITGLVRLKNIVNKKSKKIIHSDMNYNKYSYKGVRIDRMKMTEKKEIMDKIESILFLGSKHQKRGQGIQKIGNENRDIIKNLIW